MLLLTLSPQDKCRHVSLHYRNKHTHRKNVHDLEYQSRWLNLRHEWAAKHYKSRDTEKRPEDASDGGELKKPTCRKNYRKKKKKRDIWVYCWLRGGIRYTSKSLNGCHVHMKIPCAVSSHKSHVGDNTGSKCCYNSVKNVALPLLSRRSDGSWITKSSVQDSSLLKGWIHKYF